MKKTGIFFFLLLVVTVAQSQKKQPLTGYISAGANTMVYDRFINYTHAGAGAGLQLYYTINSKLKAQFDVTGSIFSINKILVVFENGQTAWPTQFVLTAMPGLVYVPSKNVELGFAAGPSVLESKVYAGIKPSFNYYLGKKKRGKAFTSLTHVFEKNSISKKNMGFISFGLALKLF